MVPPLPELIGWLVGKQANAEETGVGKGSPVETCTSQNEKMSSQEACSPPCCSDLLPKQIRYILQGPLLQEAFFDTKVAISLL